MNHILHLLHSAFLWAFSEDGRALATWILALKPSVPVSRPGIVMLAGRLAGAALWLGGYASKAVGFLVGSMLALASGIAGFARHLLTVRRQKKAKASRLARRRNARIRRLRRAAYKPFL